MSSPRPAPWTPPSPLPSTLLTPRLLLRYPVPEDGPAMFKAIDSSRDTLVPWLPWAEKDHRTVHESVFNIERMRRARDQAAMDEESNRVYGYVLSIFERDSGELVGGTGFNRIVADTADAETGYWLRADRRGRGYCTEASAHLLSWGLSEQSRGGWGFRRIRIYAASANGPSCAVPARLGLRQEQHSVRDRWVDGRGYTDTLGWGVVADEWDTARHARR